MWPFKKDSAKSYREPQPNDWVLGQGTRDGFPMLVRMADCYTGLAPLPAYDHHVIVSVHFRNRQLNGFPSSEEGDDLESLERSLCHLLETGNDTLGVLVVTNNGLRDFIFYTRNVEEVRRKIDDSVSLFQGFVTEVMIEPDPGWDIFQAFCRMLGRNASPKRVN
jgi:hypothetical protein